MAAKTRRSISLDEKIEKQEAKVSSLKERYDSEVDVLKNLMDKRDALKRQHITDALMKSSKTEEEILAFLAEDDDTDQE